VRDATGGFQGALLFLAAAMAVTAVAIFILGHSMRDLIRPNVLARAPSER